VTVPVLRCEIRVASSCKVVYTIPSSGPRCGNESFGASYARTLHVWGERFDAAWPDIAALGFDERFRRMWRYHLAYCEGGFRSGRVGVSQIALRRP
jgi:cyclopropane fatty-acyl-phospholipid synthase-like methyltransferase